MPEIVSCPRCASQNVMFSPKRKVHICEDCGHEFTSVSPLTPQRIFLSYGHDANEELVRRIRTDLEQRGHDVWFDKNPDKGKGIVSFEDWRRAITDGILKSNRVLSFLSKHSTRNPGVCRDEIAIAIGVKGGNIQTILVESEQEVQPPVNIGHIQWLDMHDWKESHGVVHSEKDNDGNAFSVGDAAWEQWYQAKLAEIVRVVESDESRRFAGEIETLNGHLKPIKSEARICQLLSKSFYGREWLFEAVEKWRSASIGGPSGTDSRLFWIMGAPGVGKSAFAAQLTHTRGDTVIAAQFCEWDKPDHRNAERVVRSLAFQLATRLPDYRKLLLTLPEIEGEKLDRKDAAELFDYLLANPLRSVINGGRQRYLIVIDALDEAGEAGRNPLVEMLARNAQRLPDWLGLVVTSRPEFDVKTPLQALNPFPLDSQSESNLTDIRDYLLRELASPLLNRPDADGLVEKILEKSEGVFLYAERFCDDVQQGNLSLDHPDHFPQGLGGIFCQYFQRNFPDLEKFRKDVRPALRAILAAREPLPVAILQHLLNWQCEELRDFTRPLASLFPITGESDHEVIKPYHKSLADWLADDAKAGSHFVSIKEGRKVLSQFCWNNYQQGPAEVRSFALKNLALYLIAASDWESLSLLFYETAFMTARTALLGAKDFFAELNGELEGFVQHELIVPIYVCSTFADLQLEREALHFRVFPEIKRRFQTIPIQIHPIDFAWVTSTAPLNSDHQVMRLRGEALRVFQCQRLFSFLVLLGQRYGWRPLPEEISADEFQCLEHAAERIETYSNGQSPVEVLHHWYRRDENSLLPVYILQPRRRLDPNGNDFTRSDVWREHEHQLWQVINRAFPVSDLAGRFEIPHSANGYLPSVVRFQASAMEQEIWSGALSAPNAHENALAFFREIDPPQHIPDAQHLRDYFDLSAGTIDVASYTAQRELESAIKTRLGDNAVELRSAQLIVSSDQFGKTTVAVSTDHLEQLCREAVTRLTALINRQIKYYWPEAQLSDSGNHKRLAERSMTRELEIEQDEHFRFGRERGAKEAFVGRQNQLQRILNYVNDDSSQPFVIHGASGCGKTALLARAVGDIPDEKHSIVRFIGVTSGSSDLRSLLRSLCQELRQRNPIEGAIHSDIRELVDEFRKHLQAATAEQPVILFLDALDQLAESENGRQLFWIPFGKLPSHVKIVVSCLSDRDEKDPVAQPFVALHRRNLPTDNMCNLDALTRDEAMTLLFDRWLRAEGRTVNETQRRLIEQRLDFVECRQPLYLKLLFEEMNLWRSYDASTEPGVGVPALLKQRIDRMSLATSFGAALVHSALAYLLTSKSGLSIWEWWEILSNDERVMTMAMASAKQNGHESSVVELPWEVWFSLYSELSRLLTHRAVYGNDVVSFSNKEIADFLSERYTAGEQGLDYHRRLAAYFKQKSLRSRPDGTKVPDVRALMELAYQSTQCSSW